MATNRLLALIIVAATVLFAIGVASESAEEGEESPAHVEAEAQEAAEEGIEGEEAHEEGEESPAESEEAESEAAHADSEELLGIDVESTPLVVLAVVVSLALAAGVWLRPGLGPLLVVVGAAMIVFAALDVREVFHQLDEDRGGLALLAGVVAVLHASAAVLTWRVGTGGGETGTAEKIRP